MVLYLQYESEDLSMSETERELPLFRELKYTNIVGNREDFSTNEDQYFLKQAGYTSLDVVNNMQDKLNNDEFFNVKASISALKNTLTSKIAGDSFFIPEAQLDTFTLKNPKAIKELKPARKERKARKQLYKQKLEVLQTLEQKDNPSPEEVHAIEKEILIIEGYETRQDMYGNLFSLVEAKYLFLKNKSLTLENNENNEEQKNELATFYEQHTYLKDILSQNQSNLSKEDLIKLADQKLYEKLYSDCATMVNTYNATNWGDKSFKKIGIELKNSTIKGKINELLKLKSTLNNKYSSIIRARGDFKEIISLLPNTDLPNINDKFDHLRNVLSSFNATLANNKNMQNSLEYLEFRKYIINHNLNDIKDWDGFFKYIQEIDSLGLTVYDEKFNGSYVNNIILTLKHNYPQNKPLPNWRNAIEPVVIPPVDTMGKEKTSQNKNTNHENNNESSKELDYQCALHQKSCNTMINNYNCTNWGEKGFKELNLTLKNTTTKGKIAELQRFMKTYESKYQSRVIFKDIIDSTNSIVGTTASKDYIIEQIVLGINDFHTAVRKSHAFAEKTIILSYLSTVKPYSNLRTYNDCYDYIVKFDSQGFDLSAMPVNGSKTYKSLMLYLKDHMSNSKKRI